MIYYQDENIKIRDYGVMPFLNKRENLHFLQKDSITFLTLPLGNPLY